MAEVLGQARDLELLMLKPRAQAPEAATAAKDPTAKDPHGKGTAQPAALDGNESVASERDSLNGGDSQALSDVSSEDETPISTCTLEALRFRIRGQLRPKIRDGCSGQLVVAVVVGNWRRVEILQRRPLAGEEGSEVHEAHVRLGKEDLNQALQVMVFQVGADIALEAELAATFLRQSKVLHTPELASDAGNPRRPEPHFATMGAYTAPKQWCLAEFIVDGNASFPFDEDQMEKLVALTPPKARAEPGTEAKTEQKEAPAAEPPRGLLAPVLRRGG